MQKAVKKRILSIACILSFCVCMAMGSVQAYGANVDERVDETIEARYANISSYTTGLVLNGSTFTATGNVRAKVKASISTTMTLQRQSGSSWSDVASWYDSTTGSGLSLSKNYVAGTRGTYRVRAVYTVNGETITTYSNTKTY